MASEPKEDSVHFLVLTDVCGNRTYGVVAQYYRPLHVRDSGGPPPKSGPSVCYCAGTHSAWQHVQGTVAPSVLAVLCTPPPWTSLPSPPPAPGHHSSAFCLQGREVPVLDTSCPWTCPARGLCAWLLSLSVSFSESSHAGASRFCPQTPTLLRIEAGTGWVER